MFPFPSNLQAKKTATLGPPARIYIQGMTETETCFQETCFRFHQSMEKSEKMIPPNWGRQICPRQADQGMTEMETFFQKTCFRFHHSLVNSEKNDPAKVGWANLPTAGRFARGQKNSNPIQINIS
jgi:hypothetical protein